MRRLAGLLALVLLVRCGADASGNSSSSPMSGSDSSSTGKPDAAGEAPGPAGPPETEIEVATEAPQAAGGFVFVLATALDAVVRIDAKTLVVKLIEVGGEPSVLRTLGDGTLVVANRGTQDFSVIHGAADAAGEPSVITVPAPTTVTHVEVAPDGQHAVAWYDPDTATSDDPVGNLQSVLVLDLTAGAEAAFRIGVGFHPMSVTFAAGKAFVVTESGVSVIALAEVAGPGFVPALPVSPDPLSSSDDREVLITSDGAHAVVRRGGVAELRIIDLGTGEATVVPLDGAPTDVDLAGSEAIVVLREAALLVRVPLADPSKQTTIDLGVTPAGLVTLTPDASQAILFSTLAGNEWVAILDLATGKLRPYAIEKSIAAIAPSPDGKTALILHTKADGTPQPGDDIHTLVDKSEGYSVLDLASGFTMLELTDSKPGAIAFLPSGDKCYVCVPDTTGAGHHEVADVDLRTMLVTPRPLGSPPVHALAIPSAGRIAVSQDHPVGRITFIDTKTGTTDTVTGFELNGLIE